MALGSADFTRLLSSCTGKLGAPNSTSTTHSFDFLLSYWLGNRLQ